MAVRRRIFTQAEYQPVPQWELQEQDNTKQLFIPFPTESEFELHGDDCFKVQASGVRLVDLSFTLGVRYNRVIEKNMGRPDDSSTVTDFLSTHVLFTFISEGILLLLAIGWSIYTYKKIKEAYKKEVENTTHILTTLKLIPPDQPLEAKILDQKDIHLDEQSQKDKEEKEQLNNILREMLEEDKELSKRYQSIKVDIDESGRLGLRFIFPVKTDAEENNWKTNLKKKKDKFLNKHKPFFLFLSMNSWVWWCLFIATVCFADYALPVPRYIPIYISLAICMVIASPLLIIPCYHWFKNNKEAREKIGQIAPDDFSLEKRHAQLLQHKLIAEAFRRKQYQDFIKEQEKYREEKLGIEPVSQIAPQPMVVPAQKYTRKENKIVKSLASFITTLFSTIIGLEFISWFIAGFFELAKYSLFAIPVVNNVVGGLIIGYGLLKAIYCAVTAYQNKDEQNQSSLHPAKKLYPAKFTECDQLITHLLSESKELNIPGREKLNEMQQALRKQNAALTKPRTRFEKFELFWIHVIDPNVTGITLPRFFWDASIFIPVFFVSAFMASNPVTLVLFIAFGVTFASARGYEYYQDYRKAEEIKYHGINENTGKLIEQAKEFEETLKLEEKLHQSQNKNQEIFSRLLEAADDLENIITPNVLNIVNRQKTESPESQVSIAATTEPNSAFTEPKSIDRLNSVSTINGDSDEEREWYHPPTVTSIKQTLYSSKQGNHASPIISENGKGERLAKTAVFC